MLAIIVDVSIPTLAKRWSNVCFRVATLPNVGIELLTLDQRLANVGIKINNYGQNLLLGEGKCWPNVEATVCRIYVGPTLAVRTKLHWANIICQRGHVHCANIGPT